MFIQVIFILAAFATIGGTVIGIHKWWTSRRSQNNRTIQNPTIKHALKTSKSTRAPRYSVAGIQCEVYMGLMGGTESYTWDSIELDYQHEPIILPEPITHNADYLLEVEEINARKENREFYNSPCVRLHDFRHQIFQSETGLEKKRPLLRLRPTTWFEYTLGNRLIDREILVPGRGSTTIRNEYADENKLSVEKDISEIVLSNILTTTVVLVTKDKWTLVGRRTARVDNAPNVLAATTAENVHRWLDEPIVQGEIWSEPRFRSMDLEDKKVEIQLIDEFYKPLTSPNPFFTALRGVEEEVSFTLGRRLSKENLRLLCVAWDLGGFNPHLFFRLDADITARDISALIDGSRASDSFEATPIPVQFEPTGKLREWLIEEPWADISKAALLRALASEYGYDELERCLA